MLSLIGLVGLAARFWQLGEMPAGFYHDEAYNGLDALRVLAGQHALFFAENNGREPAFVYLTAVGIVFFGRTIFAVRAAAAVVGTFTILPVYLLGKTWFDRWVGLLAAWLWAVTVWPVHLSRIGFRAVMMAPIMAFTLWLGTMAYRRQNRWLWLSAGIIYGLGFYTYLAIRFTPILWVLFAGYLFFTKRWHKVWPTAMWFVVGALLTLLPLIVLAWQMPALILGRPGQVSILNSTINDGDLFGTLWHNIWSALGMFFWRGDDILRHNPANRPVFDWLLFIPFLWGIWFCLRQWRKPAMMATLLITTIMLGPTILAEDTPHFLRAVGVLPAVLFLPAIGLQEIWRLEIKEWRFFLLPISNLQSPISKLLKIIPFILLFGSLWFGFRDYRQYAQDEQTAYMFEAAVSDLAADIKQDAGINTVLIEGKLWQNRPTLPYLLAEEANIMQFQDLNSVSGKISLPMSLYSWPHQSQVPLWSALTMPVQIKVERGSNARGDLETEAYSLYLRYQLMPAKTYQPLVRFGKDVHLLIAEKTSDDCFLRKNEKVLCVNLLWQTDKQSLEELVTFVHLVDANGLITQSDHVPANGLMPATTWQPNWQIWDQHIIKLRQQLDSTDQWLEIGVYKAATVERMPAFSTQNELLGDVWQLSEK